MPRLGGRGETVNMMNDITTDWYKNLVTDCKAIVTERLYRSRQEIIEGWHEVGERIATDPNYRKHAHGNTDIKKQLAIDIGASVQTLYYAIQFFEKFPTLESVNALPEGKNLSWSKIIKNHLPEPKEPQTGNEFCTCPKCGQSHTPPPAVPQVRRGKESENDMTMNNPTVDDMRIIASKINAEGQTSRAEFLYTLSNHVEELQARIAALETALEEIREKAVDTQGEFACVSETYLGEDVLPIREIENIASALLKQKSA